MCYRLLYLNLELFQLDHFLLYSSHFLKLLNDDVVKLYGYFNFQHRALRFSKTESMLSLDIIRVGIGNGQ